jgi:hypothetical protein
MEALGSIIQQSSGLMDDGMSVLKFSTVPHFKLLQLFVGGIIQPNVWDILF